MIPRVIAFTLAAALALFLALWLRKPSAEAPARLPAAVTEAPESPSTPRTENGAPAPATETPRSTGPAPALHGLRLLSREEAEKRGWAAPVKLPTPAETAAEAVWRKWKETPISVNCTDAPLVEFLEDLRARYGLETRIDPELDVEAHTVTFRVEELAGDQAFDLILKMADLAWCIDERGTLWITTKDRVDQLAPARGKPLSADESWMAASIRGGYPDMESPPMTVQRAEWMKGRAVNATIANLPLQQAVQELCEGGGLTLFWSQGAIDLAARAPIASLVGEDLPLWPSIEQMLTPAGLGLACWSGGSAVVQTAEEIRELEEWEVECGKTTKKLAKRKTDLAARTVRIEGKVLTLQAVAAQIEAQLGVKVRVMPGLKEREAAWEADGLEQTAGEVLNILASDAPLAWGFMPERNWDAPEDEPWVIWLVNLK